MDGEDETNIGDAYQSQGGLRVQSKPYQQYFHFRVNYSRLTEEEKRKYWENYRRIMKMGESSDQISLERHVGSIISDSE